MPQEHIRADSFLVFVGILGAPDSPRVAAAIISGVADWVNQEVGQQIQPRQH
jgi:hypothetical protein